MSRDVICPTCGTAVPLDPPDSPLAPTPTARTAEDVLPRTYDDSSPPPGPPGDEPAPTLPEFDVLTAPAEAPSNPAFPFSTPTESHSVSRSGDRLSALSALDLGPPTRPGPGASPRPPADPEDPPSGEAGPSWSRVLLGSYASAATIACLWLLWRGRPPAPTRAEPEPAPVTAAAEDHSGPEGLRGGHSRRVVPGEPIPADHQTTLGAPLRVGDLEVTPQEIRREPVILVRRRLDGTEQARLGGDRALRLRLRLRNLASDAVFSPLDEAFLRDDGRGLPGCVIEAKGGRRIYPYPLAVASEWSILGEEFRDLRPGEVLEMDIVAEADVPDPPVGPLTWRLRLRTGPDRTDTVGVRIEAGQVP